MKCQHCEKLGLRSRLYIRGSVTLHVDQPEVYYDEDGVFHVHDPNWQVQSYRCSNDHQFSARRRQGCAADGCQFKPLFEVLEEPAPAGEVVN
jgi:hypothetical protein